MAQTRTVRTSQHWPRPQPRVAAPAAPVAAPIQAADARAGLLTAAAAASPRRFQVLSPFINVRASQSITSEALAQYDDDQVLQADRIEGNWVQPCAVYGGGRRGWAMIDGA